MAPPHRHNTSLSDGLSLRGLTEQAELLAEAIVDTVRESLLVLDHDLCIRLASRSFYLTFHVSPEQTLDHTIYELGDGQWNLPRPRELLEEILPKNDILRDFEFSNEFPQIGRKTMTLNARKLRRREDQEDLILLAIEDVTTLNLTDVCARSAEHRARLSNQETRPWQDRSPDQFRSSRLKEGERVCGGRGQFVRISPAREDLLSNSAYDTRDRYRG